MSVKSEGRGQMGCYGDTHRLSCLLFCTDPIALSLLLLPFRRVPGALLHPPHPHRYPPVLPGAGSGSEDPAWQHRGVELRVPAARRHRGLQPDGETPARPAVKAKRPHQSCVNHIKCAPGVDRSITNATVIGSDKMSRDQ